MAVPNRVPVDVEVSDTGEERNGDGTAENGDVVSCTALDEQFPDGGD